MLEELTLPRPHHPAAAASAAADIPGLVHRHAATLFRVAHALLRNRAEAEDTVQDTFVRVLQHPERLPAILDLRPWLIRITWNLALDKCRARKRGATPDQADELFLQSLVAPQTPADQALLESQQTRLVLAAIDRLPRAERQVLLLSALSELSTAEIALTMHKSESSVRALLFRARTHLRQRVQTPARHTQGGK